MADDAALRNRRYRAHKQGDHSLCRHDRAVPVITRLPDPPAGDLDPIEELRRLAGRLLAAVEADPSNAGLVRECRLTLLALAPAPGGPVDTEVAGLMAELRGDELAARYRERYDGPPAS